MMVGHTSSALVHLEFAELPVLRRGSTRAGMRRRFRRHPLAVAGAVVLALLVFGAVLAPLLSPFDPDRSDLDARVQPPSVEHVMGTDELGRDLLTRLLYGGRVSLTIGALATALAVVVGTAIGAVAGYYGGWIDGALMRATDLFLAFPRLFVLILLTALLRRLEVPGLDPGSPAPLLLVIGLLSWMSVARLVRAEYLSVREKQFVEAARGVGARNRRIILNHILPNAASPIVVAATLGVGASIITESGLSYLGFGIQPPTPTWGNMLQNAQAQMTLAPWTAIFPGLMIFAAVISINYVGDGLRDVLDPQHDSR